MRSDSFRRTGLSCAVALVFFVTPEVHAQFLGHNLPGDFGLLSGSQAPPGRYTGVIVPYYRSDTIKLEGGRELPSRPGSELDIWAIAPFVIFVTDYKLLGGNYGAVIAPSFANADLEIPRLDVDQDQFGFGDLYLVPFQLGWHWERICSTARRLLTTGLQIRQPALSALHS